MNDIQIFLILRILLNSVQFNLFLYFFGGERVDVASPSSLGFSLK